MARRLREDFPGAWHHVFHRGARRSPIFSGDEHCTAFLDCVADTVERQRVEFHAYSLMPNHYHLLLRTPLGNLSGAMRQLNASYTQRLNRQHAWDGPLFRGRFGSQCVRDDGQLLYVLAYIHLNPVKAHLVPRPDAECWTSHRAYLGLDEAPPWLTTSPILQMFGGSRARLGDFVRGLHIGREPWPDEFDTESGRLRGPSPEEAYRKSAARPLSEPAPRAPEDPEHTLRRVTRVTGAPLPELREPRHGPRANPARRFAVWALRNATRLSHSAIGRQLGMSTNQVAKVLRRIGREGGDPRIGEWMRAWDGSRGASQVSSG
jgi:REP element-mobilizing transposase RayT